MPSRNQTQKPTSPVNPESPAAYREELREGPYNPGPRWPHGIPRPSRRKILIYSAALLLALAAGTAAVWLMLEQTPPAVREAEREEFMQRDGVPFPVADPNLR